MCKRKHRLVSSKCANESCFAKRKWSIHYCSRSWWNVIKNEDGQLLSAPTSLAAASAGLSHPEVPPPCWRLSLWHSQAPGPTTRSQGILSASFLGRLITKLPGLHYTTIFFFSPNQGSQCIMTGYFPTKWVRVSVSDSCKDDISLHWVRTQYKANSCV